MKIGDRVYFIYLYGEKVYTTIQKIELDCVYGEWVGDKGYHDKWGCMNIDNHQYPLHKINREKISLKEFKV